MVIGIDDYGMIFASEAELKIEPIEFDTEKVKSTVFGFAGQMLM